METYIFKLNLEPVILNIYSNNLEQLKEDVIPYDLSRTFNEIGVFHESNLIHYSGDPFDVHKVKEDSDYIKMVDNLELLLNMYNEVLSKYSGKGEIVYSQEYMILRDELDNNIKSIYNKFPIIEFKIIDMKNVFNITMFSKVQMGVTFLQRAGKIKKFIENYDQDRITNVDFYYDKDNEHILIEKNDLVNDDTAAIKQAAIIEESINNNTKLTYIQRITINPVYDFLDFEGQYARIKMIIVYPNGCAAKARSTAIEQIDAASEIREFFASKGEKIDLKDLEPIAKGYAESGYLREIFVTGREKIIGKIKRKKIN